MVINHVEYNCDTDEMSSIEHFTLTNFHKCAKCGKRFKEKDEVVLTPHGDGTYTLEHEKCHHGGDLSAYVPRIPVIDGQISLFPKEGGKITVDMRNRVKTIIKN